MEYEEFLQQKLKTKVESGFIVSEKKLNPHLFDFQKFIVLRALKAGKYAIFADCGLGKTLMQLEWANRVSSYTRKPVLILAPLAVSGQTIKEGEKFGIAVRKYDGGNSGIQITNYEQLENIDCSLFSGVVLDESSILKNFEGATKKLIIDSFANTPYKLACTATPSPNDPMEMGNHSEFLNIMSRNQMLAMYFTHDSSETAKWRIKGHAHNKFYEFIGQWAIMLSKPSDIGFVSDGFDLPRLNIVENNIVTEERDNGLLFNDTAISATNFNSELRQTKEQRLQKVIEIVNSKPNENFIVWIKHNDEGEILKKAIADSVEIKGSDSSEQKEFVSLWFGNYQNECICNTKETKKSISVNIGSNIMSKTKMPSVQKMQSGSSKKENLMLNTENQDFNIIESITPKINPNGTQKLQKKKSEITTEEECFIQETKNIEKKPKNQHEKQLSGIRKQNSSVTLKNTDSQSTIMESYTNLKTEDAQFVEQNQHYSTTSKDSILTTAIQQGKLEDCYARTAIKESESLMIAKYCSNVPLCTCCGKHKRKIIISKVKILSYGMNYQNCHNQIFASLDFSFEGLYQAIRRSYRFGQKEQVNIYLITTDTMTNVIQSINDKQEKFNTLKNNMTNFLNYSNAKN